jgi:hypothetical protein
MPTTDEAATAWADKRVWLLVFGDGVCVAVAERTREDANKITK